MEEVLGLGAPLHSLTIVLMYLFFKERCHKGCPLEEFTRVEPQM